MICMMMAMSMAMQHQQLEVTALQQRVHELEAVVERVEPVAKRVPRHLVKKRKVVTGFESPHAATVGTCARSLRSMDPRA